MQLIQKYHFDICQKFNPQLFRASENQFYGNISEQDFEKFRLSIERLFFEGCAILILPLQLRLKRRGIFPLIKS